MASDAPRHLILVGLMGSGKTTVGGLVAQRLARPFLDSDQVIEDRTGRSVREIFEADGEPAFRVLEAEVLREALDVDEPAVIAAAGGTVLSADNRRRLEAAGTVVWLRAEPDVLVARVESGGHRPLLDDHPEATLVQMAVDREPLYREIADVTVVTSGRPPDEVADEIMGALP